MRLALAWMLLACFGPPDWSSCDAAPCRAAAAESAWGKDSEEVAQTLRTLDDPFERAALLEQLAYAFPADRDRICGLAPRDSPAAVRCRKLRLWPHLTEKSEPGGDRNGRRKASGPSTPKLPSPNIELPTRPEEAVRGTCGREAACLTDLAVEHAQQGATVRGANACLLAWPEGTAVLGECLLRVARVASREQGLSGLRDTLATCGLTGRVEVNCLHRALVEAMPVPTPADHPDPAVVTEATRATELVQRMVPGRTGAIYADYMWSEWLVSSLQQAEVLTGHLHSLLPPGARPHLRTAGAWWLVQHQGLTPGIEALADGLQQALTTPVEPGWTTTERPEREYTTLNAAAGYRATWTRDRSKEGILPAIYCLSSGRRTVAEDPLVDARIAVLEAALRVAPDLDLPVLEPYLARDQPLALRWTATRIHQDLFPRADLEMARSDPNPLVRWRARSQGKPTNP